MPVSPAEFFSVFRKSAFVLTTPAVARTGTPTGTPDCDCMFFSAQTDERG